MPLSEHKKALALLGGWPTLKKIRKIDESSIVSFHHIPRNWNKKADSWSNEY